MLVGFRSVVDGSVSEDCGIVEAGTSAVGMMTVGVARLSPVAVTRSGSAVAIEFFTTVSVTIAEHAASSRLEAMINLVDLPVIFRGTK